MSKDIRLVGEFLKEGCQNVTCHDLGIPASFTYDERLAWCRKCKYWMEPEANVNFLNFHADFLPHCISLR